MKQTFPRDGLYLQMHIRHHFCHNNYSQIVHSLLHKREQFGKISLPWKRNTILKAKRKTVASKIKVLTTLLVSTARTSFTAGLYVFSVYCWLYFVFVKTYCKESEANKD